MDKNAPLEEVYNLLDVFRANAEDVWEDDRLSVIVAGPDHEDYAEAWAEWRNAVDELPSLLGELVEIAASLPEPHETD